MYSFIYDAGCYATHGITLRHSDLEIRQPTTSRTRLLFGTQEPPRRILLAKCTWTSKVPNIMSSIPQTRSNGLYAVLQSPRNKPFRIFHKDQIRKPTKLKVLPLVCWVFGGPGRGRLGHAAYGTQLKKGPDDGESSSLVCRRLPEGGQLLRLILVEVCSMGPSLVHDGIYLDPKSM